VIIEVLVDLSLDFLDPLIERLEDLLPRFANNLGQASVAKPVADLRALLNQIIKVANERLQFLLLRLRRRPERGVMAQALACDQRGVGAIGLVTLQFALAKGLDLRRIDYANRMPCAMKAFGQVEAISAGGFHHGVDSPHALFGKPGLQSSKTIRRVGELALVLVQIFEGRQTEPVSTSPYAASTASHTCRIMAPGLVISDVSNCPFLILFANSIPLKVTSAFPNVLNPSIG
jgi:hypothetical protein